MALAIGHSGERAFATALRDALAPFTTLDGRVVVPSVVPGRPRHGRIVGACAELWLRSRTSGTINVVFVAPRSVRVPDQAQAESPLPLAGAGRFLQ